MNRLVTYLLSTRIKVQNTLTALVNTKVQSVFIKKFITITSLLTKQATSATIVKTKLITKLLKHEIQNLIRVFTADIVNSLVVNQVNNYVHLFRIKNRILEDTIVNSFSVYITSTVKFYYLKREDNGNLLREDGGLIPLG